MDDYSTPSFIQSFIRLACEVGYPKTLLPDEGSQLIKASKEVASLTKDWNWSAVAQWAAESNIEWKFVPSEGQHMNGLSESLIRSVKRSIQHVVGANVLSCLELQTAFFEIAHILNSRPIGIKSGRKLTIEDFRIDNDVLVQYVKHSHLTTF